MKPTDKSYLIDIEGFKCWTVDLNTIDGVIDLLNSTDKRIVIQKIIPNAYWDDMFVKAFTHDITIVDDDEE